MTITWKNVNAPSFADTARISELGARGISDGVNALANATNGITDTRISNFNLEKKNATDNEIASILTASPETLASIDPSTLSGVDQLRVAEAIQGRKQDDLVNALTQATLTGREVTNEYLPEQLRVGLGIDRESLINKQTTNKFLPQNLENEQSLRGLDVAIRQAQATNAPELFQAQANQAQSNAAVAQSNAKFADSKNSASLRLSEAQTEASIASTANRYLEARIKNSSLAELESAKGEVSKISDIIARNTKGSNVDGSRIIAEAIKEKIPVGTINEMFTDLKGLKVEYKKKDPILSSKEIEGLAQNSKEAGWFANDLDYSSAVSALTVAANLPYLSKEEILKSYSANTNINSFYGSAPELDTENFLKELQALSEINKKQ